MFNRLNHLVFSFDKLGMNIFRTSIPPAAPEDIIQWAEENVKVDGHSFDSARTPQLIEPIRAMADADTRIGTLVKPVQIGGSTAGEVVACYWASFANGLFFYSWEDDRKAENRWLDRIQPALESCKSIRRTGGRYEELICSARYVNVTIRCQGVYVETALDSDTVPLMINEEIHAWKPGFLSKARRRQTQVWNAKAFDISNAAEVGGQLESTYQDGTMEQWESYCPGCQKFHVMQFRFDKNKPELGGLRWDTDGCKMDNGRFNYNKLEPTIHYQMPCGFKVENNPIARRALKGRYSQPQNEGAHLSHRSWNFEAVSCDSISWLHLIQEWHGAYRALRAGDIQPLRRFVTERECKFFNEESVPYRGAVIINSGIKKSREGLPERVARIWAADAQKGYRHKGELSHYWLVIRDVMENCDSLLVFEGMVQTDLDLITILDEHNCKRRCGVIDATWDTKRILEFCYRNGINATIGSAKQDWFAHTDKVRRFYSVPKAIHAELNVPPKYNYSPSMAGFVPAMDEPMIWHYNKAGLLSNLMFIRNHRQSIINVKGEAQPWEYIAHEVPSDVSEDYKIHNEAWERKQSTRGRSKEQIEEWKQTRQADHMMLCEGYIAMMMEMEGLLGSRLAMLGNQIQTKEETK